jgi:hypothetical protein
MSYRSKRVRHEYEEKDLDIDEIFNEVINKKTLEPKSYPLEFEVDSLKELFEFLLQFVTMLCKHFYGDINNQVNLNTLTENDFKKINEYIMCIGFTCNFQSLPANANNLNHVFTHRFDKVVITETTLFRDLLFGIKCDQMLHVINFDFI